MSNVLRDDGVCPLARGLSWWLDESRPRALMAPRVIVGPEG